MKNNVPLFPANTLWRPSLFRYFLSAKLRLPLANPVANAVEGRGGGGSYLIGVLVLTSLYGIMELKLNSQHFYTLQIIPRPEKSALLFHYVVVLSKTLHDQCKSPSQLYY